jgi:hypothetical protein
MDIICLKISCDGPPDKAQFDLHAIVRPNHNNPKKETLIIDRWNSYTVNKLTLELEFHFLGHRDYVHGSSMLDGMILAVTKMIPAAHKKQVQIKQFRIIREIDSNATVEAMPSDAALNYPSIKNAAARLDLHTPQGMYTGLLFAKPGAIVSNRIDEYDARDYVSQVRINSEGSSVAKLKSIKNTLDLVRAIVEANRQITWKEIGTDIEVNKMRWAFLTNFPWIDDNLAGKFETVIFSKPRNMNTPNRLFPIKSFDIPGLKFDIRPEICFFIEQQDSIDKIPD